MFNEVPEKEREKKLTDGGLEISRLENIKLVHREGNAVIRRHLENLPLETFDSVSLIFSLSLSLSLSSYVCARARVSIPTLKEHKKC
jgi:hypothetical protein